MYEKFYYDALEERIRVVAAGKEGEHEVFLDRLLLFREVYTHKSINYWSYNRSYFFIEEFGLRFFYILIKLGKFVDKNNQNS